MVFYAVVFLPWESALFFYFEKSVKVPKISIFLLFFSEAIGFDLDLRRCKVLPFFSTKIYGQFAVWSIRGTYMISSASCPTARPRSPTP